jgi:sortase A
MRKLAYVLILLGLGLMLYPSFNHWYEDYKQQKLLHSLEQTEPMTIYPEPASSKSVANQINQLFEADDTAAVQLPNQDIAAPTSETKTIKKVELSAKEPILKPVIQKKASVTPKPEAIGILQIDMINLKLPVVEGIRKQDLEIAPGHIPGTALPGQIGNAVIAGHHSYSYGRMFNRLEELKIGDAVKVKVGRKTYVYTIIVKKMVEPGDISVLSYNKTDTILTLITCDADGKRRLILQAKIK